MQLTKHHGLGNDFLVVLDDANAAPVVVDGALAVRLCERRRGVGADGLIHGARPPAGSDADVVMHLFNADGSRAEMSGNGIRCLAQAVVGHRHPDAIGEPGRFRVEIDTDTGRRSVVVERTGHPDEVRATVAMGSARPGPPLPASVSELLVDRHATIDMGNPHLVVLVADPGAVDVVHQGSWLEQQFEHGANVEFIAAPARDELVLHVWERGAGITEACGTGACAAAHVAHAWGLVDERVTVRMPGGAADVVLDGDLVTLIGPSVRIAACTVVVPEHPRA